jgi:diguanylate cyclase (GGDEF)-like protein
MGAVDRRSPSLRRTWLTQTLLVGTVLTLIGVLALGASAYQREAFRHTTSDLERASSALVDLRMTLNDVDDPAAGVMYGLGGPDAAAGHLARYQEMGREIDAGFDRLHEAAPPAAGPAISRAETHWAEMDSGVLAAPELLLSGAVAESMKTGTDLFADVWTQFGLMHEQLAEVERLNVEDLRQQAAAVDRIQSWIPGVLLGVLVVAMLCLVWGARRMSQRVVAPLEELRRAALSMRGAGVVAPIDVRRASAELQVLAQTIEETALSLRVSHSELRDQARTDVLTGLPNRKAFVEELETRFAQPDERLGVLFVDLDDFKIVNDSLGHAAGDELLQVVGARLRAAVRQGDLVARLGGDEFAVLVSCAEDPAAAALVAGAVLGALDEQVVISGMRITIDCSVGVATAGAGVESPEVLLRNADFAMYMAKGRGKNCVETFAPSMHLAMQLQSDFKRDLALAAVLDQLVLHHQPVLDLTSGRVLGFEALVRWEHPDRGLVPPMDFISLAEETGDILGIGKWVLEQACADLADYRLQHPGQSLWMSVNVSAQQLADPGFVAMVLGTLASHRLDAGALVLELTEHAAVANTAVANAALEALRSQGVRVALDDFGVGFSTLRYLRELPVDVLKIDRSFVVDAGDKANSMLSAIVSLAHTLDLDVIAEGIEEPEQLGRLQQLGALAGQGYLFSRPVPTEEATLLLSGRLLLPAAT